MSDFQQWASSDTAPWLPVNENFDALEGASLYAENKAAHSGLVYGLMGGVFKDTVKAATTTTLADATTNYIVAALADGTISDATTTTNWDDDATYARVAKVTTAGGAITVVVDYRFDEFGLFPMLGGGGVGGSVAGSDTQVQFNDGGAFGAEAGFEYDKTTNTLTAANIVASTSAKRGSDELGTKELLQNSQSAAYTTVLADAGKHLLHPAADTNARTFTIAANASVAYPIGTAITFINETAQVLSIAINSDTLTLANSTTTGTRSLAQNGMATAIKVTSTKWIISGAGLT